MTSALEQALRKRSAPLSSEASILKFHYDDVFGFKRPKWLQAGSNLACLESPPTDFRTGQSRAK
jgi:hypothetical protein